MLLSRIDPRVTTNDARSMAANSMEDRHSQSVIAGGPAGVMSSQFASWHAAYSDNFEITVQLHRIKRVVAFTNWDCGAAKLAFGPAAVATRDAETTAHSEVLRSFAAVVRRRKPSLVVVTGIMDLNGGVELVS